MYRERFTLLKRFNSTISETLGTLIVLDDQGSVVYDCSTLELPFINNAKGISCIPGGMYKMILEYSPKFGRNLWELIGVPGRSEVKIHAGNYTSQIEGCILTGTRHVDINSDGLIDVSNSQDALSGFMEAMGECQAAFIQVIHC